MKKAKDSIQQKIEQMKQRGNRQPSEAIKTTASMRKTKCLSMRKAAYQLGIGFKTLFEILRENGHFIKIARNNLPKPELIEKGYFRNELKDFKRGRITGQYIKTYVTPNGMSFLAEAIQDNQKGNNNG